MPITTLFLQPGNADDWICLLHERRKPLSRHPDKQTLTSIARAIARRYAPSRLVLLRHDGSVEKIHRYNH
ncbi:hypothetical protein KQI63_13455 [bacterium]|nr:hypothetical protein [bacterium]